ncbi:glycosyltransferase [Micromonospora tulbaghiae]|uniref:glycosyltransferase family A protein n=1 Tax=Micromonospora tulbaghiae TaxID=479978 RepID=UPI0033FDE039
MSAPALSVVVPASCTARRHGSSRLRLALVSLCNQTLDRQQYEVIVVDNGSDPPVEELLQKWDLVGQVRVHRLTGPGLARAYNAGIALARAPLVLLGTDDELLAPGALAAHVSHHASNSKPRVGFGRCRFVFHTEAFLDVTTAEPVPGAVAGMVRRADAVWLRGALTALGLADRPITVADVQTRFDSILALSGSDPSFVDIERVVGSGRCHQMAAGWLAMRVGNHTVPTAALRAVGGIDEALDQHGGWYLDIDLGLRLVQHGLVFGLVDAAVSTNLTHPRGDGYLLGAVPAMSYLINKHRRMDVALSPLYFQRGFGIASFSRMLAAAAGLPDSAAGLLAASVSNADR